jgi:hypothetical protein
MTNIEKLREAILKIADRNQPFPIRTHELAVRHHVEERYVRQLLVQLASGGWISLAAWDGTRLLSYDEWPSIEQFFKSNDDNG